MPPAGSPLNVPAKRVLSAIFVEAGGPAASRLPKELEERAVRRLGWMILSVGAAFLVSVPLRAWVAFADGHPTLSFFAQLVSGGLAIVSLLTFLVVRLAPLDRAFVLQIGLLYEVVLCFALALVEQILVGFAPMPLRLSLVAVVLFTFPLVVPSPPRWRLVTTALAAATLPAALAWISILLDGALDVRDVLLASVPTLIVAGIAAWLSQVVHRLRVEAGRAVVYGQYELVEKLGEGGMGEVWKARHAHLLRPAAIKLIRPDNTSAYGDAARKRFEREAQATGALRSPHTVSLYELGTTDDGQLYYAMELLEGIDAERCVQRFGPMPAERVVHLLTQVARSLAEAHQLGLVHRDIKPANVFLCRMGTQVDFVKVLDFGLVKPRHLAEDSPVSVAGAVSGTPGYVAPEHLAGREIDDRADLYALGCVAFFLLTGKRVFRGKARMEILTAHLTQDPQPPSTRVPGLAVPAVVDQLVLRLLARDPSARTPSAQALLEELEAARRELPAWDERAMQTWWYAHLPEHMRTPHPLVL